VREVDQSKAFTLVEIMIVVVIIGVLAALAVPAFQNIRERTQNTRFFNDCRIFAAAAETWSLETGNAFPDPNTGNLTPTLQEYVNLSNWFRSPSIGGNWDFDTDYGYAGVGAVDFTVGAAQIQRLDRSLDDGVATTGQIRIQGNRVYYAYSSL
jgi:prepilin-type N-terminal cleavage/methylation domain-containing protein